MKIGYESNGMAQGGFGEREYENNYYNIKHYKQYKLTNYEWRYPFLEYPIRPIEKCYVTGEKGWRNLFGYWEHVNSTDLISLNNYLVYSMADGVIEQVGQNKIYGNYVIITSIIEWNDQLFVCRIRYSHLSIVYCKVGQYQLKGHHFAVMGNTGRTNKTKSYNGVHLDLEIQINGQFVNPFNNAIWQERIEL